jgi:hypothetical protein
VPGLSGVDAAARLAPFENNVRLELKTGTPPAELASALAKAHGVDALAAQAFVERVLAALPAEG